MAVTRPGPQPLPRCLFGLMGGLLLLVSFSARAAPPSLDVEITGVRSARGVIHIAVFGSDGSYRRSVDPVARVSLEAVEGTVTAHLELPEEGKYAISVFHDENDNGALDTSRLGLPVEGYGFSNGASGRFGKPSFSRIALAVGDGPVASEIRLLYFFD